MKNLFLLQILFVFNLSVSAQTLIQNINSYTPPSPEAASLSNQNAKYSIDMYTGRLGYYAQLSAFEIDGVKIDLGLQYSTSGFKVQDVSSSLGLGWNATYSGVITRYVEGLPDEDANGYCGANQIGAKAYVTPNAEYFTKTTSGDWDSQPDKFMFSFQGFSGSFKLDANGAPVLESGMTGLKILYSPFNRTNGRNNGGAENWIIADQFGNTYVFGNAAVETTESTHHLTSGDKVKTYISSWYIKNITNVNQQQIEYLYETGPQMTYKFYLNARRSTQTQGPCSLNGVSDTDYNEDIDIKVSQPLYLTTIRSADAEIAVGFTYSNGRLDLSGGRSLAQVSILHSNVVKKKFIFDYDYFIENGDLASRRLKLNAVQEVLIGSSDVKNLYRFYYNPSRNLPARNSLKTDYWGYYNNNPGSSNIEGYQNANKQPSFDHSSASVLFKVKNVTGGFLNFEFEQNDYFNGSTNTPAGGIRIKKVYETESEFTATRLNAQEYFYLNPTTTASSGQVYTNQSNAQLRLDYAVIWLGGVCVITQTYRYSEPIMSIFDLNNAAVGYSNIAVNKANGTIRYKFTNYQEWPDVFDERKFDPSGSPDAPYSSNYNLAPQLPVTSNSKFRGKILSEEIYDLNNQKVKSIAYSYSTTPQSTPVIGIKAFPIYIISNNNSIAYSYVRYSFASQDLRLSSKIETMFKNNAVISSSTENFTYSTYAANLLTKKASSQIGGKTIFDSFRYACDIPTTVTATAYAHIAPMQYLRDKNIIGTPIESIRSFTDQGQPEKVMSAKLIKYKAVNSLVVLPWKEYVLELNAPILKSQFSVFQTANVSGYESDAIDARYSERIINTYNSKGKIIQKIAAQDTLVRQAYMWGYKGRYIVAEATNAANSHIHFEGFESIENYQNLNIPVSAIRKHTGSRSAVLTSSSLQLLNQWMFISSSSMSRTFTISGWVYLTGSSAAIKLMMSPDLVSSSTDGISTTQTGNWVYLQKQVTVPANMKYLNASLECTGGTAYFDDLKIHPSSASMITYTVQPLVGMTSKTNLQNQSTFYEYDEFNRLKLIKDNDGNIIKAYHYNYKN